MIDDAVIESYMRDADPIPNIDDLDADEFARFAAAADARRAAAVQAPGEQLVTPTPIRLLARRRPVWVFAMAFIVAVAGIGTTVLVLRGDEPPVAGQPTTPTTLSEAGAAHLEPVPLQLGTVAGFARSGDTLWVWDVAGGIAGYREGVWEGYPALPIRAFDVAGTSGGAVWALTGFDADSSTLWYLEEGVWRQLPGEVQPELEIVEVDEATGILWLTTPGSLLRWDGVEMTSAGSPPRQMVIDEVAVTGDGTVWVSRFNPYFPGSGGLARYHDDTGTWESVRPLGGDRDLHAVLAPTPDGNLWVLLADFRVSELPPAAGALAYFDSTTGEWTIHRLPEEVLGDLAADDEGIWWVRLGIEGLAGVVRFDGQTRTTYLPQLTVDELGVGADGTLWVSTGGTVGVNRVVIDEAVGGNDAATTTASPGTAGTGTVMISVQGWSGVEGYRLLAGVWDGYDIVGGAFWTLIDSDPFSGEDVVHPPYLGEDEEGDYEDWGAGDYVWEETARLEPGTYRIDFWANPGELKPYGNYVPSIPVERSCWVDVEVIAGEASKVVITDIPVDGPCQVASS
jgi:hypothetical protein